MKKILIFVIMAVVMLTLSVQTFAYYEPDTNYMSLMIDAVESGDIDAGASAQESRDEKIIGMSLDYDHITFEDLYLLSKIIYAEAGSDWLSDEWKLCVGEVVLNRVNSPVFPSSIPEVLYQPGQYYGADSTYFKELMPSRRCINLAQRLLEGERKMEPSVVFQANFEQGSGVYRSYHDELLGWTYFCYA